MRLNPSSPSGFSPSARRFVKEKRVVWMATDPGEQCEVNCATGTLAFRRGRLNAEAERRAEIENGDGEREEKRKRKARSEACSIAVFPSSVCGHVSFICCYC